MSYQVPNENDGGIISISIGDSTSPIMAQEEIQQEIDQANNMANEVDMPSNIEDPPTKNIAAAADFAGEDTEKTIGKTVGSKRAKKSSVWNDFKETKDANGVTKISYIHCKRMFAKNKTTPTTQLHRHLKRLQCTRVVEGSCIKVQDTINNGKRYFSHSDNQRCF